jgi:hypothetical protein
MTKQKILEGVKAGDAVIVSWQAFGPDRVVRKVRSVDYVARVFKHVLQTRGGVCGVEIEAGRALTGCGYVYVTPATAQDVTDVLREIEDRNRADAEHKARREAEYEEQRRRDRLSSEIREIVMYRHVPESVLVRALDLLRGEDKDGE